MQQATVIFLVALLLGGCSNNGTRIEPTQLTNLVRGETTEQQVIQRFGKPSTVSMTSASKMLIYDHTRDNRMGKHVVASTASVLGGVAGGALGSLAGGLVGNQVVPNQSSRERLVVTIDPTSGTVSDYQFQQSRSGM